MEAESWTLLRKRGIRLRMRCSGQIASQIEQAFTTVEQLVEAVESEADLTEYDGIGRAIAEVIDEWWANRFEREARMDDASVEQTGEKTATIHFHSSWNGALSERSDDGDGDQEFRADGGHPIQTTAPGKFHDNAEQVQAALTELKYYLSRADVPPNLSTLDPNLRRSRAHLKAVLRSVATDGQALHDGGQYMNGDEHVEWWEQAFENTGEWGLQDVETLLLAMQEELGELTQAHLEASAEGGDPDRVEAELVDLGALCFQLQWALTRREEQPATHTEGSR